VRRRGSNDAEENIKKAFGKNFEFSEKYLTSNLDPNIIIKAIKRRYQFKKVTRATLKHILYEGARLNKVLRINDSCFDKMVDVLNIPVGDDEDDEEEESQQNPNDTTQKHE